MTQQNSVEQASAAKRRDARLLVRCSQLQQVVLPDGLQFSLQPDHSGRQRLLHDRLQRYFVLVRFAIFC